MPLPTTPPTEGILADLAVIGWNIGSFISNEYILLADLAIKSTNQNLAIIRTGCLKEAFYYGKLLLKLCQQIIKIVTIVTVCF